MTSIKRLNCEYDLILKLLRKKEILRQTRNPQEMNRLNYLVFNLII